MARTRERKNVKKQLEKRNVFIEKGRPINDDILCWVNKHSRWQFSNTQYILSRLEVIFLKNM